MVHPKEKKERNSIDKKYFGEQKAKNKLLRTTRIGSTEKKRKKREKYRWRE